MRLKCIKLAGFKSFVDPTTVQFPSNMCAVVGPNGCGKSNIIDAVRWVMGESSAKNLRGESMTDVIFNGSNARKPVGQASVELVFDNSDGTIRGEYAAFAEISVRRKVTRDAKNNYYLNGTKCRRRDITDIFLGTGLGPRSYSIISQGIISNLIESKPEELRVFIEEAAGISKYKERRRDTENRIRRTNENLERLTDLRDELERQLHHLHSQAQATEKYKEYKADERLKKAQLSALRWRGIDSEVSDKEAIIRDLEVRMESFVADQRSMDAAIEKKRDHHTQLTDRFNEVQGRFYSVGGEIARIEQTIQHTRERSRQLLEDLQQVEHNWDESNRHLEADRELVERLQLELEELEPELELVRETEEEATLTLESAEEAMQEWQQQWDSFNQKASEPRQRAEVEQSRIQHIEQVVARLGERIRKLQDERAELSVGEAEEELELLSEQLSELEMAGDDQQMSHEGLQETIEQRREAIQQTSAQLDALRTRLQSQQGRRASLEALQQAALGQQGSLGQWLEQQALADRPRLAENLQVEEGWEQALETVLGDTLQAVCVEGLDPVVELLEGLDAGTLTLFESNSPGGASGTAPNTLLSKIRSDSDLSGLLEGVLVADELSDALAQRGALKGQQSIITRDGVWVGRNWLRVARDEDQQAGVLQRQQELEELVAAIGNDQMQVESMAEQLEKEREALKTAEAERESLQKAIAEQGRRQSEVRAELSGRRVRIEQVAARRDSIDTELEELREQQGLEQEKLGEARLVLQESLDRMENDAGQREQLLRQRDDNRARLDTARQRSRHDKDRSHQLQLRYQSIRTQLDATLGGQQRLKAQIEQLAERKQQLQLGLSQTDEPALEHKLVLEELLEQRVLVEEELAESRRQVEALDHQMREHEKQRSEAEQQANTLRGQLEHIRMAWQALQVHREKLQEQLLEEQFDLPTVLDNLPPDATESEWEDQLRRLDNRIQRLGAINLAAIDEYKAQAERKEYLDAQNNDLVEALTTLENAIRRIDRETRSRFKETFEKVNSGLQLLFPKVFGGGHAYLELTGDDLLDTGVTIMARPPGKKNSTIHLLSGGEKALTAIALVFSIFQLNPAPFCMLDEVDAPLDDANVGRYARMVEEMSSSVQFIYITHNKIAMEAGNQLMGVTMHEPGVSRMVSVDIEEAAALAAV
ncbi:chromosome segregation protein SMC [Aestuariirhabdus litorea]|uniref:Chromosome partition protein Smc n=1 Tax=Aestuariirhabdus litorea TaxID=2528527 RepID=A0A3P3VQ10_9GAMM|nr:chromosome segregation protein SMC [Aestuariirhabdus litorea]RRJ84417.1 chromosome segregation protein SMC [Aestuariirhabdus litorea]RWW97641.1 chromosome segregation protein SMC [Endozoicomonadaceae bacterium GTF-13]